MGQIKLASRPHIYVGEEINVVVDPHTEKALKIESLFGDDYGPAVILDKHANLNRKRYRPDNIKKTPTVKSALNSVELALKEHSQLCGIPITKKILNEEK